VKYVAEGSGVKESDLTGKSDMPIILVTDWRHVPCPRVLHVVRSVLVDANIVNGAFHHPGLVGAEGWQPALDNLDHRVWVATMGDGLKEPAKIINIVSVFFLQTKYFTDLCCNLSF
jgi:hypothetical protein